QGNVEQDLDTQVGDFVIRRADGLFAYQLAVVVDDAAQGITEVVRGSDLLDSTARQLHLQTLLGLPRPGYVHLPVATDPGGHKLSKQTHAAPLDLDHPVPALWQALAFLGQQPPPLLQRANLDTLLEWALANWRIATVPRIATAISGP
ncbi:MAG: tRNA glutamyl-Q(34) synthetase GluQRS, partial [Pseudomonadota bacterium]